MRYVFKKKKYVILFSVLDALGTVLMLASWIARRALPFKVDRMLIIRGDHIGDVIAATVVLEPLREAFPEATIDFVAPSWAADILSANPFLDNVIPFDPPWFDRSAGGPVFDMNGFRELVELIRKGNYELAIDLRGDFRHILAMYLAGVRYRIGYGVTGGGFLLTHMVPYDTKKHETERNAALLEPLGIEGETGKVGLFLSEEDDEKTDIVRREYGIEKDYAVVHPVPGHKAKNWNEYDFAQVVKYVHDDKGLMPLIVGSESDGKAAKEILSLAGVEGVDLSGKTSLATLGWLASGASLFIGVDSGPSHIAASTGIPSVILFSGVNDPEQWAPKGDNVRIVYPGEGKDLSWVTPPQVYKAIDEVLEKR